MEFRSLFNVTTKWRTARPTIPGEAKLTAAEEESKQGVFLTPQSLVTFPGATAAVLLVWRVADMLIPSWGESLWIPFFASIVAGAFIWMIAATDPKTIMTRRDKLIAVGIAAINSLQVFVAAVGIPSLG